MSENNPEKQAPAPQHSRMFTSGVCQHAIGTATARQVAIRFEIQRPLGICEWWPIHSMCRRTCCQVVIRIMGWNSD